MLDKEFPNSDRPSQSGRRSAISRIDLRHHPDKIRKVIDRDNFPQSESETTGQKSKTLHSSHRRPERFCCVRGNPGRIFFFKHSFYFSNITSLTVAVRKENGNHVQTDNNRDIGRLSSLMGSSKISSAILYDCHTRLCFV